MDVSNIASEIKQLSKKSLSEIINTLEKVEDKLELNPTDKPFYYQTTSNEECGILRKLTNWGVLEFIEDDLGEGPFLQGDVNEVQEIETLLKDRVIQVQSAEQAVPPTITPKFVKLNSKRKFVGEERKGIETRGYSFKNIPLNYLKQERTVIEKILAKIQYSESSGSVPLRCSEFSGKYFTPSTDLTSAYAALDRIKGILVRFKKFGVLHNFEYGESAMQNTIVTLDVNESGLDDYKSALFTEISARDASLRRKQAEKVEAASHDLQPINYRNDDGFEYSLIVSDRDVMINDYVISRPHAVGNNLEFLEHVIKLEEDSEVKKNTLPMDLKESFSGKSFFKVLNELGFKGNIRKLFFYKVSKDSFKFRGSIVLKKQLKRLRISEETLINELMSSDKKYHPK